MLPWLRSRYWRLRPVVDPVVRRGVEHPLERPEPADGLGVDPELVDEVDAPRRLDHLGAQAQERQQAVGHEGAERVGHGLAQRGGQVVALAGVVHHVDGPHVPAGVHEPVVPVVDEVPPQHRGGHGRRPGAQVGQDPPLEQLATGGAGRPGAGDGGPGGGDGRHGRRSRDAAGRPGPAARGPGRGGARRGNRRHGGTDVRGGRPGPGPPGSSPPSSRPARATASATTAATAAPPATPRTARPYRPRPTSSFWNRGRVTSGARRLATPMDRLATVSRAS